MQRRGVARGERGDRGRQPGPQQRVDVAQRDQRVEVGLEHGRGAAPVRCAVTRGPRNVPSPSRFDRGGERLGGVGHGLLAEAGEQTSFSTRGAPNVRSWSTPSSPSTGVGESRMIAAVCAG